MSNELTIEVFAAVRARLDAGEPSSPVIDEKVWPHIQETWLGRLADALDRGDVELLRAYDEAYRRAYAERTGVELSPIALPVAEAEPYGGPPKGVPEEPASRMDTTTAALSIADIERAVLPYMQGAAPAPAPPSAVDDLGDHPLVGETGFIKLNLDGPVLPFGRPPPSAAAAPPPSGAFEPSADDAAGGPRTIQRGRASDEVLDEPSVNETAFMTALVIEEPLPFKPATSRDAFPPRPAETHEPHPDTGATTHITVGSVPISTALPFAPVSAQGGTMIGDRTLQELAALEVEIGHGVGRVPEVLAAFGLDRAQFVALRRELERRCEVDPSLKDQLEAERAAYAAWRKQQTR